MAVDRTAQFANGTAIAAGQTDAVIQAAIPGRKIRVLSVFVFPTTTPPANVTFNSKGSGAGTAISPVLPLVASVPLSVVGPAEVGVFQTNAGEALTVTNPAGTTLAVFMVAYVVIS
jgi:hypothetical protein